MQCLSSILTWVWIRLWKLPQDRGEQEGLQQSSGQRGEGERSYILTGLRDARRGKAKTDGVAVSGGIFRVISRHLRMLYTVRWECVCVGVSLCVCVCVCEKACLMDLSLRAAFLPPALALISDPPRRPGCSFWCAAGGSCATGPGGRSSRTPSPAGGRGTRRLGRFCSLRFIYYTSWVHFRLNYTIHIQFQHWICIN